MSGKTTKNGARTLVLASTSRYRKALLERLGIPFEIAAPDIDEAPLVGESPAATACRLAEAKARAVAARYTEALIIGSDQVADAGGMAISKPGDHSGAVAQLEALSGRTIVFHTAIALVDAASRRCQLRLVDVRSTFRTLSPTAIEQYLRREQPYDCAGAVKSEALGIALFDAHRKRRSDRADRLAADRADRPAARRRRRRAGCGCAIAPIALARYAFGPQRRPEPRLRTAGGRAGALYLVPNLLGAVPPANVLPARTIDIARNLAHWVVETPKAARAFLKSIDVARPIAELAISAPVPATRGRRNRRARSSRLRGRARCGACCPMPAVPAWPIRARSLVAAAHAASIRVVPLVGPSAILLALMASGMNGQQFAFHGYLPVKPDARAMRCARSSSARAPRRARSSSSRRLIAMSRCSARWRRALKPATRVCVAADLTLTTETIECRTAARWRDGRTTRASTSGRRFSCCRRKRQYEEPGHAVAGPERRRRARRHPATASASSSGQSLM